MPTAPRLRMLLPDGWTRLALDDDLEQSIREIVRTAMTRIPPAKRDIARVRLRSRLEQAFVPARDQGLTEAWFPVAPTSGIQLPVTVVVGPMPDPPGADLSVPDHLLAFTAGVDGARAVEVAGALGVRLRRDRAPQHDDAGNLTAPRTRVITYVVGPGPAADAWFTIVASLFVPDGEEQAEIVQALELFVDALVGTLAPDEASPERRRRAS